MNNAIALQRSVHALRLAEVRIVAAAPQPQKVEFPKGARRRLQDGLKRASIWDIGGGAERANRTELFHRQSEMQGLRSAHRQAGDRSLSPTRANAVISFDQRQDLLDKIPPQQLQIGWPCRDVE